MKLNISPKSTRIELSNDTFAERKCCEIFAYESQTFHRRRGNGISHCENGEQTSPSHWTTLTPSNTAVLGPPQAPPQTTAPTVEALSHTYAVKLQWRAPNSPPKVPLPVDRSPNPTVCLIPGPVRPMMPNGIRIRSAVFPQCTAQTDARTHRQTDRQTDRSSTGKFDD